MKVAGFLVLHAVKLSKRYVSAFKIGASFWANIVIVSCRVESL